ncbi:MAG: ankyrin repeat domain-containing protein, partial [Akkermansia sp.]|nr:ankyrin repeat domain-containing protein [Akkermansia sp.]
CKYAISAEQQRHLLELLPRIRQGESVNLVLPNTNGRTALHYSCGIGSLSITRWLLEHGANPNARDNNGMVPLRCVGNDNRAAIIRVLQDYGAQW